MPSWSLGEEGSSTDSMDKSKRSDGRGDAD